MNGSSWSKLHFRLVVEAFYKQVSALMLLNQMTHSTVTTTQFMNLNTFNNIQI
jgi:hypothetical protein